VALLYRHRFVRHAHASPLVVNHRDFSCQESDHSPASGAALHKDRHGVDALNTMTTLSSAGSAARDLSAQLDPDRVLMSGLAYDEGRRIWNGAVDNRPAVIVRCATPAEVGLALIAARSHQLPLSVRGGGPGWAGRALRHGGLVIDLSKMRQVAIDTKARTAIVGGGTTAGDLIAAAAPHKLSAATGTVGAVGMAGLTLGGGYGPLNGCFGLALDNLL